MSLSSTALKASAGAALFASGVAATFKIIDHPTTARTVEQGLGFKVLTCTRTPAEGFDDVGEPSFTEETVWVDGSGKVSRTWDFYYKIDASDEKGYLRSRKIPACMDCAIEEDYGHDREHKYEEYFYVYEPNDDGVSCTKEEIFSTHSNGARSERVVWTKTWPNSAEELNYVIMDYMYPAGAHDMSPETEAHVCLEGARAKMYPTWTTTFVNGAPTAKAPAVDWFRKELENAGVPWDEKFVVNFDLGTITTNEELSKAVEDALALKDTKVPLKSFVNTEELSKAGEAVVALKDTAIPLKGITSKGQLREAAEAVVALKKRGGVDLGAVTTVSQLLEAAEELGEEQDTHCQESHVVPVVVGAVLVLAFKFVILSSIAVSCKVFHGRKPLDALTKLPVGEAVAIKPEVGVAATTGPQQGSAAPPQFIIDEHGKVWDPEQIPLTCAEEP